MIDEEKIIDASYDFEDGELVQDKLKRAAFRCGVNWFKENLWHPMSDKPEMGAEILIQRNMEVWRKHHPGLNVKSTAVYDLDFHDSWESYEHDDEYKRWLYIEDLIKGDKK